jgi:hypothetical protein
MTATSALPPPALTLRQQAFVELYLCTLCATSSYTAAGYKAKNANVAAVSAYRLLRNPKIRAAIDAALAERSQRNHLTQDFVLASLIREANAHGPGTSHSARVRALELLGRHLGMGLSNHQEKAGAPDPSAAPAPPGHEPLIDIEDLSPATRVAILEDLRQARLRREQGQRNAIAAGAPALSAGCHRKGDNSCSPPSEW